jgi:hypothetical protein
MELRDFLLVIGGFLVGLVAMYVAFDAALAGRGRAAKRRPDVFIGNLDVFNSAGDPVLSAQHLSCRTLERLLQEVNAGRITHRGQKTRTDGSRPCQCFMR